MSTQADFDFKVGLLFGWIMLAWLCLPGCGKPPEPVAPARPPSAPEESRQAASPAPIRWTPSDDDWFETVPAIDFTYRSGRDSGQYSILESVGGGVAMLDFDRDGDLDLVFASGGTISSSAVSGHRLAAFRNDGDWRFVEVASAIGLDTAIDYSHGISVSDFDRDGWPDLFVTCYGRSHLLRNDRGVFKNVTQEYGLAFDGWSTGAVWFDANQDPWPDLFVIGYVDWQPGDAPCIERVRDVCPPQKYDAAKDRLFLNVEGSRFVEQTDAGIRAGGKGLGVIASDFNADGRVDLYVANDSVANQLYTGNGDGTFQEIGDLAGVSVNAVGAPEGSMGVDFGDVDGDGRGDLWVTNFQLEDNSLYRNLGDNLYQHATVAFGLGGSNRANVGFGTGFVDFDLDGWLDLFVVNGHVRYHDDAPLRQPPSLFQNTQGHRFQQLTDRGGEWFAGPHIGRGAAWGDLDGDGDEDLVVVSQDEPVALLRNRSDPPAWIGVRLAGTQCDPQAVGSALEISYQQRTLTRWVTSGSGYLSHSDPTIHLPVAGDTDSVSVAVHWVGGGTEVFDDLLANRTHLLVQGQGN